MANLFVRSRPATQWSASAAKSLGDRVVATSAAAYLGIHFECTTAGTTGGAEPSWNTTVGGATNDGTCVWTTRGSAAPWQANATYALGDRVTPTSGYVPADAKSYVYECTTAGTAGASEPTWVYTTPDTSTTTSGTAVFTCRKCTTWDNANISLDWLLRATSGSGKTAAGDTIFVSKSHAESKSTTTILAFPGTGANFNKALCVDDTGDPSSPANLADTASITSTTSGSVVITGYAYIYGIRFTAGSGSSSAFIQLINTILEQGALCLENCQIKLDTTSTSATITCGTQGAVYAAIIRLINTRLKFRNNSQFINIYNARFEWLNTSDAIDISGSIPDKLIAPQYTGALIIANGVDLSAIGAGKSLIGLNNNDGPFEAEFMNCKLGSGGVITSGAHLGAGGPIINAINCSSDSTNYRVYRETFAGKLTEETTLVRTDGASDGTTPIAWKIVTNTAAQTLWPFESLPIYLWNDTAGSGKTLTIEILHDSATALKDNEIWVEVEYLGSSSVPLGSRASDRAGILATPADQAASSATWTTTGMTNPNKQKLEVAFTPQMKGIVKAIVCVGKPSYTVYVDPLITLT
jgi:hypothetical protein